MAHLPRLAILSLTGCLPLLQGPLWPADARAASPSLKVVLPRGAQQGTETVLTLRGDQLKDTQELFFYEPGFTVSKIEPEENGKSVKVTVKIAGDCQPGEHTLQVRTATGVSDYRTFYVGNLPETKEQEPNNDFAAPQPIPLGTTVTGIAENEDVDHFVVDMQKGQRLSVEIEGLRLGTEINTAFDPFIAILRDDRFELAVADDTPLVHQDGVAAIVAPEAGRYIIQVRDSSYRGNGNSHYRLHVGEFPRPLAAYPAGGPAGQKVDVKFIGDPAGEFTQQIELPADPAVPFAVFPQQNGKTSPSANPFRVSPFGNVLEVEPNNSLGEATPAARPNAFNGIIGTPEDIDFFKFAAKKGESLKVECFGRRLRTALDPVVDLFNIKGQRLAGSDDNNGPDPSFDFSVPDDGEYVVSVRDHLRRGESTYVYRLEITPQEPGLSISIPRVTRYDQDRQQIVVPRGGRYSTLINASRRNFGGEIVVKADQLPQGVTMDFAPMAANMNSMPVTFTATADAPLAGRLTDLRGYRKEGDQAQSGKFTNTADLVRYRNNEMLWGRDVDRVAIAVVEKLPYSIEIEQPKVPLVKNGTLGLKIIARRDEGFTKPITVEFPFRPPGVGALPSMTIPEGQNEVIYILNGDGKAQAATWKVYAFGIADVGGKGFVSSPFIDLAVADSYLDVTMERTAARQGEATEVFAKLNQKTAFEGSATLSLLGLPNKVVVEPVQVTKETTEVRFKVLVAGDSPTGRHQNLFCEVKLPQNGGEMVHRAGGVELRIDPPPPQPKEKPAEKPATPVAKAEPEKTPAKPLSRLEQLRLEAKGTN